MADIGQAMARRGRGFSMRIVYHDADRARESIEREAGTPAASGAAEVRKMLSGLGEPEALVGQEHARLAAARGEPGRAPARPGRLIAQPAAWLTRRSSPWPASSGNRRA